jgi:hypothetical protein
MSKLLIALVVAAFGLASMPAYSQPAEKKESSVREEGREAKAKAKRGAKKVQKKARQAKAKARDAVKKDDDKK